MKTPGSGRQAGTPNKTTREMRELAQQYGPDCLAFWASVLNDPNADFEHRHACAKELADRGYGKPSRTIELQAGRGSGIDYENLTDAELAVRARVVFDQLAAQRAAKQLPAQSVADGEEIVDGGVVVPDPAPEPQGVTPVGAKPKEPQPNDL